MRDFSGNGMEIRGFHPVPLLDLQATDQVMVDGEAPLHLSSSAREVAGEATRHEVALLI
jgi:hypothetical protein